MKREDEKRERERERIAEVAHVKEEERRDRPSLWFLLLIGEEHDEGAVVESVVANNSAASLPHPRAGERKGERERK